MTTTDDATDQGVGTVAEEAAKLLGALSGWARENGDGLHEGLAHGVSSIAEELHDHVATGTPECTWCPVCRTVAVVRQASPEVKAHLTSAASSLMMAVSGLLATRPPADEAGAGGVERIRVDDDAPADVWDDAEADRAEDAPS